MSDNSPTRERIITDGDTVKVILQQDCQGVIDGVRAFSSVLNKRSKGNKYLGSVPLVVAEIWAGECKAPIGSREFIQYAHGKLMSPEYSKFKVHLT